MAKPPKGFDALFRQLDPLASALRHARRDEAAAAASPSAPKKRIAVKKAAKKKTSGKVKRSPLAPDRFPDIPVLPSVRLLTAETHLKYKGRPDLLIVDMPAGTTAAGVFTQSTTASAPIEWCRSLIDSEQGGENIRGLVVNAGNSNTFTGRSGRDEVKATVAAAAKAMGCRQKSVLVGSTGVIGEKLPENLIADHIPKRFSVARSDDWLQAATAIMTTDTYPKGVHEVAQIDGTQVNIAGIAKGSGMIAPDLATMFGFIFTDAAIPAPVLQTLLSLNVRHSFNAITVDSDTSTSDMVLLFATGDVDDYDPIERLGDRRLGDFRTKLAKVMLSLAHQIVRDGEGARKFITINVTGAQSAKAARTIAMAIGNSPLVKTAIAGEDANWGRVVAAVGKSGQAADRDKLSISFGGHLVAAHGEAAPDYDEDLVSAHLRGDEVVVDVDVGVGSGEATIWTCDLTHDYISINADYRS